MYRLSYGLPAHSHVGKRRGNVRHRQHLQARRQLRPQRVRSAGPVVSVRTAGEVPKAKVFDVAHALNTALVTLPVAAGDVVIPDVCGTGVAVVATKSAR